MKDDMKRFQKFFLLFRPYWLSYGISSTMVSCRNLMITWLTALISSRVVAAVSEGRNIGLFHEFMRFLLFLLVFILFDTIGQYLQVTTIQKIGNLLRSHLYRSILRASIPEAERFGQRSELISRTNRDVDIATNFLSGGLITFVMFIVSGIGATAVIARESVGVCIGLYGLGFAGLLIQTKLAKRIRNSFSSMQKESSDALSLYMKTISQSEEIRMAGLSNTVSVSFFQTMRNYRKHSKAYSVMNGASGGLAEIIQFTGFFGVIGVCLYLHSAGGMSLSSVVMVSQMTSLILTMILTVYSSITNIHTSLVGIDRIFEVIDLPAEDLHGSEFCIPSDRNEQLLVRTFNAACRFRNGSSAFADLSITIPANCIVALRGESGCGKTTLMRLLLKLYPYSAGSISLFAQEVNECSASSIRRTIGYVPQENVIFSGTLRDNLLIGNRRKVEEEEMRQVLVGIGADTWVYATEGGLDTPIVDGGSNLSGGQRQMIAIARAILYHREILILDEAFAGIDSAHIQQIVDYFRQFAATRSVIIITHDAQVADCCDQSVCF